MRKRRRKAAVVVSPAIAAMCILALPPAALGATASIQGKRVFYTAATGEVNNVTVSLAGGNYTLSDPGATITGGPGCTASGNTATCPAAGINGITVSAGDEADSAVNTTPTPARLSGGDGNDSLQGGPANDNLRGNQGVDTHAGGPGDDFIDTRGDKGDLVTCGMGNDTERADASDVIDVDCEVIDRGGAPPPPRPGPKSDPSPTASDFLGPGETGKLDPGACAKDLLGTPGDDRLDGTPLGDNLFGAQGNDTLNGLRGDDCLFGGVGSDGLSGGEGDDHLLGDDSKTGVGGDDRLSGKSGDDSLVGGTGKDRLAGGSGKDSLSGDGGNDRLSGGKGDDHLTGGRGRNRLSGNSGDDRLNAVNGRRDRLDCGRGRDTAVADRFDRVRGCERVRRKR